MHKCVLSGFVRGEGTINILIIVLEVTTSSNHLEHIQIEISFYFSDDKNEALRD